MKNVLRLGSVWVKGLVDLQERIREVLDFIEKMGYQLSYIQGSWSDWLAVPKNGDQYL